MPQLKELIDMTAPEKKNAKPCPFCGANSKDLHFEKFEVMMFGCSILYRVNCDLCSGSGGYADTRIAAISKWNQRKTIRKEKR